MTAGGISGTKWLHRMKCRFPAFVIYPQSARPIRHQHRRLQKYVLGVEITARNFLQPLFSRYLEINSVSHGNKATWCALNGRIKVSFERRVEILISLLLLRLGYFYDEGNYCHINFSLFLIVESPQDFLKGQ